MVLVAGPDYFPDSYHDNRVMRTLMPVVVNEIGSSVTVQGDQKGFSVRPTSEGARIAALMLEDNLEETAYVWRSFPRINWLVDAPQVKPVAHRHLDQCRLLALAQLRKPVRLDAGKTDVAALFRQPQRQEILDTFCS